MTKFDCTMLKIMLRAFEKKMMKIIDALDEKEFKDEALKRFNYNIKIIHDDIDANKYEYALDEFYLYVCGEMKYPTNDESYDLAEITWGFLYDNFDVM